MQKQKIGRQSSPRNRYYRGAKLSEHKFLRILHGYAEGVVVQTLEPSTHVSGKTIRGAYRALREHLPLAVQAELARFSSVGSYLFDGQGSLSAAGKCILAGIEKSRRFARYIQRHAPRLNSSMGEQLFLLEKAVRIFCALDLRGVEVDDLMLAQVVEAFSALRPSEPLQKLAMLIPGARSHAHPGLRLYEDYRRYMLKNPLGT